MENQDLLQMVLSNDFPIDFLGLDDEYRNILVYCLDNKFLSAYQVLLPYLKSKDFDLERLFP